MFTSNPLHTQTQPTRRPETARRRQLDTGSHLSTRQLFDHLQQARDHHERDRVFRELIDLHAPIVERVARHYRHQDEPHEDLCHVAAVGLIQAIREFTPDRGQPFLPYALPRMTDEVHQYLRHHRRPLEAPLACLENRTALTRAVTAFEQHHGRSPRVSEIAEMLRMPRADTVELISAHSALSLGTEEAEEDPGGTAEEKHPPQGTADRAALRSALTALAPRDRKIALMRLIEHKSRTHIAEQFGVSKMHISRILSSALAKLRERSR